MAPPAVTVTSTRATTRPWVDKVQSIGTLIAIEGVEVAPEVGGIVKDYFFDSGKDVEKGAKLVELDTSVEEADLTRNQAMLLEAEPTSSGRRSLVKGRIVSQAVVDTTISKRDTAAASVQKMEAQIAQKNIKAPFSGRLGLRHVEKGQYVKPGRRARLAAVARSDLDRLPGAGRRRRQIEARRRDRAHGQRLSRQGVQGRDRGIRRSRGGGNAHAHGAGRLPNADHKLLPGMFANVGVLEGKPKELVTVPRTAVTYGLYGDSVWVVKESPPAPEKTAAVGDTAVPTPQLTAERRFVRVGPTQGDRGGDSRRRQDRRAGHHQRPAQAASRYGDQDRQCAAADASSRAPEAVTPDVLHRYLHQAAGAGHGRQPAHSADRRAGGLQAADPAISRSCPTPPSR